MVTEHAPLSTDRSFGGREGRDGPGVTPPCVTQTPYHGDGMSASLITALLAGVLAIPTPTRPPRDPPGSPSERIGDNMIVMGAVLGAAWIGAKAYVTAVDPGIAIHYDRTGTTPWKNPYAGPLVHGPSAPVLITSMGLLGGGMRRLGVHHAWRDGDAGWSTRKSKIVLATGIALLGVGAVTFVSGLRISYAMGLPSELSGVVLREIGWWGAAAFGWSGAMLTGYAHGRLLAERRRKLIVAPDVGWGALGLSGRF